MLEYNKFPREEKQNKNVNRVMKINESVNMDNTSII